MLLINCINLTSKFRISPFSMFRFIQIPFHIDWQRIYLFIIIIVVSTFAKDTIPSRLLLSIIDTHHDARIDSISNRRVAKNKDIGKVIHPQQRTDSKFNDPHETLIKIHLKFQLLSTSTSVIDFFALSPQNFSLNYERRTLFSASPVSPFCINMAKSRKHRKPRV